jgi:hypothetical protein
MTAVLIDTNVLVYPYNRNEPAKAARARLVLNDPAQRCRGAVEPLVRPRREPVPPRATRPATAEPLRRTCTGSAHGDNLGYKNSFRCPNSCPNLRLI